MGKIVLEELTAYLDGELDAKTAQEVVARLETDASFRHAYEKLTSTRRTLRSALETPRSAAFADDVLNRIASTRRAPGLFRPIAAAAALLALLSAGLLLSLRETDAPGHFAARGEVSEEPTLRRATGVEIFVHRLSHPSRKEHARAGMGISPTDGFSFVLRNRSGRIVYLMLFGVDATGGIRWFYPSATGSESRVSFTVTAAPEIQPLKEGVTPEALPDGPFEIVSLFTETILTTADIEAQMRRGGVPRLKATYPDAALETLRLHAGTRSP